MYSLVADVDRYPDFIDYCQAATCTRRSEHDTEWKTSFGYMGWSWPVVTRNTYFPCQRIDLDLVEGPLRMLRGSWRFDAVHAGTCVELDLSYQWDEGWFAVFVPDALVLGYADRVLESFSRQARTLYGP